MSRIFLGKALFLVSFFLGSLPFCSIVGLIYAIRAVKAPNFFVELFFSYMFLTMQLTFPLLASIGDAFLFIALCWIGSILSLEWSLRLQGSQNERKWRLRVILIGFFVTFPIFLTVILTAFGMPGPL